MTVSKFFSILFRVILYPYILYWALIYYILNERKLEFDAFFSKDLLFTVSFVLFCCFVFAMLFCFISYSIRNSERPVTIIYSPKYLYDNYWDEVAKSFD